MNRWFEIRNAPKPNGTVIAVWHQTKKDYELAFGIQNLEYPPDDEDNKRTHGVDDVGVIANTLTHEISESDFSVHSEICDIPQIISDGVIHYLGVLNWHQIWHSVGSANTVEDHTIPCTGKVYTKVVMSANGWYQYDSTKRY